MAGHAPLKRFLNRALLGATRLLLAFNVNAAAQKLPPECPSEGTNSALMLNYLQRDRVAIDPRCAHLREYKPAIPTLIEYLDFEKQEVPSATKIIGGMFPAAEALGRFHGAALPALKKTIVDDNESKVARVNAAKVYIFISLRDEGPAPAFVARTARNASDSDAGKALMRVAQDEAKNCFAKDPKVCEDALKGH